MRGSRPISGSAGPLRDRLERLDGLPLRASTARRRFIDPREIASPADPGRDDPGWALAVEARGEDRALDRLAECPWWPPGEGPDAEARDRIWRFCVATSEAARVLAAEAGEPDPEAVARLGLLHPVAGWALAAAAPGRLAEWLHTEDDADRRALERSLLGRDAGGFGSNLARRWGCGPDLADVALLVGQVESAPPGLKGDPARFELVRIARGWAMRTPWAIPGPPFGDTPPEGRRRWLVATVQARTQGGLGGDLGADDPAGLLREVARQAIRGDRAEAELAELSERLDALLGVLDRERGGIRDRPSLAVLDAMAEFAAGAAHELNNPLAIIAGRAQLLRGRTDDPEHAKALQTIIGQARRAHQILRDLIYIARTPPPRRVPCVPDQVLRAVVADLDVEARSRRVRLSCRSARSSGAATTDPDALRHLADALIRNALEATPEGGEVVVTSDVGTRSLVWTVRDSGIGLDRDRAARLLDPFYCGRQAGRGLGLGLPRVARFLRASGGTIRWDDAPGGGTIVRVELPVEPIGDEASGGVLPPGLRDAG